MLHGLLGCGSNWGSFCRRMAGRFAVTAADLRGHGASPHAPRLDYPAMAADALALMDRLGLDRCHVLGHSMGGKVAMRLALDRPERLDRLVVADIAPVAYPEDGEDGPRAAVAAMRALPLDGLAGRDEADRWLARDVPDAALRGFLLTNLARGADGRWRWRLDLEAIARHYGALRGFPEGGRPHAGPALFARGARSGYVRGEHLPAIRALFPNARVETIEGAGHWPHAERPAAFEAAVSAFLLGGEAGGER